MLKAYDKGQFNNLQVRMALSFFATHKKTLISKHAQKQSQEPVGEA